MLIGLNCANHLISGPCGNGFLIVVFLLEGVVFLRLFCAFSSSVCGLGLFGIAHLNLNAVSFIIVFSNTEKINEISA